MLRPGLLPGILGAYPRRHLLRRRENEPGDAGPVRPARAWQHHHQHDRLQLHARYPGGPRRVRGGSRDNNAEDALRNARYFLSMQFGLFAIFFSTLVWGVLVILDRFKFSVGKIFILLATMYTVLMYLTHGVSVETISKPTLENVQKITRLGAREGQRRSVRASLLLRPRRGDCQV